MAVTVAVPTQWLKLTVNMDLIISSRCRQQGNKLVRADGGNEAVWWKGRRVRAPVAHPLFRTSFHTNSPIRSLKHFDKVLIKQTWYDSDPRWGQKRHTHVYEIIEGRSTRRTRGLSDTGAVTAIWGLSRWCRCLPLVGDSLNQDWWCLRYSPVNVENVVAKRASPVVERALGLCELPVMMVHL